MGRIEPRSTVGCKLFGPATLFNAIGEVETSNPTARRVHSQELVRIDSCLRGYGRRSCG